MPITASRARKNRFSINDPFKFLAREISGDLEDEEIWEEEPISMEEFIESKNFLNQKWNGKRGCRPKIKDILCKVSEPDIREAIFLLGKGSGKDYAATIVHLYGIYKCLCMYSPQMYYGLAPGSPIYFINIARNETQAKKVFFTEFKGMLQNCPWFQGRHNEPGTQNITFDKGIEALSANSQAYAWLGYNTIQVVFDELAFFLESDNNEESESRSRECWEAGYGSCQTRFPNHYKMIGITTPNHDDDFTMTKYYELKGRDDGFTAQGATWEINPNLTIRDFKYALDRDYRRCMRDFGAQPMGVMEGFWSDPKFLEENVCEVCRQCPIWQERDVNQNMYACFEYDKCRANAYMGNGEWRSWLKDVSDKDADYHMHFDLSKNKDRIGFSLTRVMGEVTVKIDPFSLFERAKKEKVALKDFDDEESFEERPIIKVEAIGWISNNPDTNGSLLKNREFHYDSVLRKCIYQLVRYGVHVTRVTADQYQSHHFKQSLEDRGFDTELISLDRTDEIPVSAKSTLVENRVEYPYDALLCQEAKNLKYLNGKKVDHARKESKDVWDGFAGSIWNAEQNYSGQGTFMELDLI